MMERYSVHVSESLTFPEKKRYYYNIKKRVNYFFRYRIEFDMNVDIFSLLYVCHGFNKMDS